MLLYLVLLTKIYILFRKVDVSCYYHYKHIMTNLEVIRFVFHKKNVLIEDNWENLVTHHAHDLV